MHSRQFAARESGFIELDLCFACQGLWFDPHENTRLAPQAVNELFELLHEHRGDASHPLAPRLRCTRCTRELARGFDVAVVDTAEISKTGGGIHCMAQALKREG